MLTNARSVHVSTTGLVSTTMVHIHATVQRAGRTKTVKMVCSFSPRSYVGAIPFINCMKNWTNILEYIPILGHGYNG